MQTTSQPTIKAVLTTINKLPNVHAMYVSAYSEFQVQVIGKPETTYFTQDREDALMTAASMSTAVAVSKAVEYDRAVQAQNAVQLKPRDVISRQSMHALRMAVCTRRAYLLESWLWSFNAGMSCCDWIESIQALNDAAIELGMTYC